MINERDLNPAAWEAKRKADKKPSEFKEPPLLGLITRVFRGIKFEFKNIHIRYEDDFFCRGSPFSFGFTIQSIFLDNNEEEEARQCSQENSTTIVKIQEVKNVAIYWNSMSEMFIPTSVWQASSD